MLKLLVALGAFGCVQCDNQKQDDDAIRYMYGGESAPLQCKEGNAAILFIYGGSKAHQFKVTHAARSPQSHDDIIAYLYSGNEPVDDVAEMSAFLYGGEPINTATPAAAAVAADDDIALFLFGKIVTESATGPPRGMATVKDDVALLERNKCLHKLTEWSPTSTFAEGKWMLEQADSADEELVLFMLSGSAPETDGVEMDKMSAILFGGDSRAVAPTSVQRLHDVDIVDKHASDTMIDLEPMMDMIDLVDMADAADSDLAMYMLGGEQETADTSDADLASFLFGSADSVQTEKTLVELVDEHQSVHIPDMVSLFQNADNADALHHLGGDAAADATLDTVNYAEDLVDLFDRVEAEDDDIALFHLGGNSEQVELGSGPSTMEEDGTTMSYLYDGHGVGTDSAVILDLYGGLPGTAVDEDMETAKFIYGITEHQPEVAATKQMSYITGEDELIEYTFSGDTEGWSSDEEAILFVLGETPTTETTTTEHTDSPAPVEQWSEALPPAPYAVDQNEDCSDHECISRTLQQMQAELGLSDEDLEDGMIWGEDMVEFCEWQKSSHSTHDGEKEEDNCDEMKSNCPTSRRRMPALPSSYSMVRPPSLATCKQVLKPASQMLK